MVLMDFAKSNRLVHTMLEPLTESFPDLPTRSHDIRKAKSLMKSAAPPVKRASIHLLPSGQCLHVALLPLLNQSSLLRRDLN